MCDGCRTWGTSSDRRWDRLNGEMEKVEVISEGKIVAEFTDFDDHFEADFAVPDGKYYRVRGTGKMQKRKYTEGEFEPLFLLNPICF